MENFDYDFEAK